MSFHRTSLQRLSDQQLLERQSALAAERRRVDGELASVAAEIAYRSRHDLGSEGLAQRLGFRTAEKLVESTAQVSPRDAGVMVRVGEMDGPVADAVAAGELSLESAEAIRAIETPELEVQLIEEAAVLPPRDLVVRARKLRDDHDPEGVAERERLAYERRGARLFARPDGTLGLNAGFDLEQSAMVRAVWDGITSPRNTGVRFVDPDAAVDAAVADTRTLEQVAVDGLVELLRIASTAGSEKILGAARPAVRVHVSAADFAARTGSGTFEGETAPVSIQTVERHACAGGIIPIVYDPTGQPLDVGRSQRLFTVRQRIALTARDGGCRFPGCDRPPSWCEAHHITPWSRGGRTDVADGILLCRHHHLLIHNNGWQVTRDGSNYFVVPPRTIDPAQRPRSAPARPPIRVAA